MGVETESSVLLLGQRELRLGVRLPGSSGWDLSRVTRRSGGAFPLIPASPSFRPACHGHEDENGSGGSRMHENTRGRVTVSAAASWRWNPVLPPDVPAARGLPESAGAGGSGVPPGAEPSVWAAGRGFLTRVGQIPAQNGSVFSPLILDCFYFSLTLWYLLLRAYGQLQAITA